MPRADNKAKRKREYHIKITKLFEQYQKLLVVGINNVASDHMQKIRREIRGSAEFVCGKNTLIRRALRMLTKQNSALEALLPSIYGNVALVFTKGNLSDVRKKLLAQKVEAPAKVGAVSPNQVIISKGPTGLEPTKTSFLQALNIASKINKGQIEITSDKVLIEAGQKVGTSEAALLQMLDIKPFSYAVTVDMVYDNGSVFEAKVLDLSDEDIVSHIKGGIRRVACVSLAIGYPTVVSLPHSIINGYKNLLAITMVTEYSFPRAERLKQIAADPTAFQTKVEPEPVKTETKPQEKEEKQVEEENEEEEDVGIGGGGLFGAEDDEW